MWNNSRAMVAFSRNNSLISKVSCTNSGIASIRAKASHPANRRRLVSRQTAPRQPAQLPGNLVITDPPQLGTSSTNADSLSCEAPHCEARHRGRPSPQAKASPLVVGTDLSHGIKNHRTAPHHQGHLPEKEARSNRPHMSTRGGSSPQAKASPLVVGTDFEHLPPDALNSTPSPAIQPASHDHRGQAITSS